IKTGNFFILEIRIVCYTNERCHSQTGREGRVDSARTIHFIFSFRYGKYSSLLYLQMAGR
ncbi:hypothetical protein PMN51_13590, partial [Blautia wexlerae]|nr:hypothetical protein [Blautia wexlerae]